MVQKRGAEIGQVSQGVHSHHRVRVVELRKSRASGFSYFPINFFSILCIYLFFLYFSFFFYISSLFLCVLFSYMPSIFLFP